MALKRLQTIFLLTVSDSVDLSVCRGVSGCMCPISFNILTMATLSNALRYMNYQCCMVDLKAAIFDL